MDRQYGVTGIERFTLDGHGPGSHQLSGTMSYLSQRPKMAIHRLASMSSAIDDKPHVIVVINAGPAHPRSR